MISNLGTPSSELQINFSVLHIDTENSADGEIITQILNSITHSYTIMPAISKNVKLLSLLFIVYSKQSDQFGLNRKKKLFKADNNYTVAVKSGKMGGKALQTWLSEVYVKNTPDLTRLFIALWSSLKNHKIIDSVTL